MKIFKISILLSLNLLLSASLCAKSLGPAFAVNEEDTIQQAYECQRVAEKLALPPAAVIAEAESEAAEKLADITKWNRGDGRPVKNGFVRTLTHPQPVSIYRETEALAQSLPYDPKHPVTLKMPGEIVWGTKVEVAGAYRLRLHLKDVHLPGETILWVYGPDGAVPVPFDLRLRDREGGLWTPSVAGSTLFLEIRMPVDPDGDASAYRVTIDSVLEIVDPAASVTEAPPRAYLQEDLESCFVDAACVTDEAIDGIDQVKEAVASIHYVKGGYGYLCTGGLVNNLLGDLTPYFLTAHHCIASQSAAATIEAYFDYINGACGGSAPPLSSVPRVLGATFLASQSESDSTLLRLSDAPWGQYVLLGWDSAALGTERIIFRISNPDGQTMHYSRTFSQDPSNVCSGLPEDKFVYSEYRFGATKGGSSGSPALNSSFQIVGQLFGKCGPNLTDPCDPSNRIVDGRLSEFYPMIRQYLDPASYPTAYVEPAGVCGGNNPCYTGIQQAADSVDTGTTIRVAAGEYDESIVIDRALTVEFGWDPDFSTTNQPDPSVIRGL